MLFDLISNAYAQDATEAVAKQPSLLSGVAPLILIMVVFYLLVIRPQNRKLKEHQNMLKTIAKGDQVVTAGGIFGEVVKVDSEKNVLHIQIADDVKIKVRQDSVSEIIRPQTIAQAA